VRYSKQSEKAACDEDAEDFDIEQSDFDWIELLSLRDVDKKVYELRMQGKKWKDIAESPSVNLSIRQAARIFKRVGSFLRKPVTTAVGRSSIATVARRTHNQRASTLPIWCNAGVN
jgi:hypothetical protein